MKNLLAGRDAEKKIREQRQLAQLRQLQPTRVRIANQPTFSRYVFELPQLISVATDRGKEKFTLVFDGALKFDLADAIALQPPMVQSVETAVDDQTTKVSFTFNGKVDIRTFREDNNYVLDVGTLDAKDKRIDAILASKPGAIALEAPANADAAKSAPVPSTEGAPPVLPTPGPPAKPAAAVMPLNPPAETPMPETASKPPSDQEAVASERKEVAAVPATDEKMNEIAPAAMPARDANSPVSVELRRQSDNLKLTFPFAGPTPAAVFRRADTLWLVFDTDARIDVAALSSDPTHTIRSVTAGRSRHGQVVRRRLERPRLTRLAAEGLAWTRTGGVMVLEPTAPLGITRNVASAPHASANHPL